MNDTKKPRTSHTAEFKAAVVLAGLSRTSSVEELCRQRGIAVSSFYEWRKRFIRAGTASLERRSSRKQATLRPRPKAEHMASRAAADFQKFRSDLAQPSRRMTIPEKLKALEVVEAAGVPKRSVLGTIGIPASTYYGWRRRLQDQGTLESGIGAPENCKLIERGEVREQVFKVLHTPPSDFGFNRTTWKLVDLQVAIEKSGLRIGRHAIRGIVKGAGYRWMKAKQVLTSNDPDYRSKLTRIQEILGELGDHEGFFSIDEYGPFAVKQRAGRKLIAPGQTHTVPQFQKSKGALIMTAALELSTNQVTHFYSKKKNTDEMIKLLDVLLTKYQHLERFFMSWDAASWHVSKRLREKIQDENLKHAQVGGPIVELAPLPAGAQFLNVIESIFSGMSRAVIHNSNYTSKEQAIAAIDRYFDERNEYFRINPRRAGKKIWGQEPSPSKFSESNNCKDSRYR